MFTFVVSFLKSIFQSMSASTTSQKLGDTSQGAADHSPFLPLPTSRHLEIEEYMRLLNMAAVSTSEGQDQLAQHVVIKLEHMKDAVGKAQHEHVVATVRDHNGYLVRLSIGRSKGHNDAPKVESKKSPKNSFSSNSTIALASIPNSSQDSILKPTAAVDVVQNIGDKAFPDSRVQSIFEPKEPIPLLRLAAITASVHQQNSHYTLLRSQCYWFAMLIMGVSMAQGGQLTTFTEKPPKSKMTKAVLQSETKYLKPLDPSNPNVDPSEWTQIPIVPPPPEMPYETVWNLGPNIGKHNSIPVVAVGIDEIRAIAMESQRCYEAELDKLAKKISGREVDSEDHKRQIREATERAEAEAERAEAATARADAAQERIAALERQLAAQPVSTQCQ